jgi:hypothetical protein
MSTPIHLLGIYLHLARASELRRRPHVRDRLLIVSAAGAQRCGLARIAEYCRHRVLENNPRHLLRRWPTVEAALQEPDFLQYLKQLQRRYPQEKAEQMLGDLQIEMGRERETYFSDEEYAAALLNTTPRQLQEMFGDS